MPQRTVLGVLVIGFMTWVWPTAPAAAQPERPPRIGIVYTAPHPVINEIIDGFKEIVVAEFPEAEFVERHASGNTSEYSSTVLSVLGQDLSLLAPITTPITRLALEESRGQVPIVFMGVTDPVGAGIVESLARPGNATGSSDVCPFVALLDLTRQTLPGAKTLGLAYNPADQPAVFGQGEFERLAPEFGFVLSSKQVSALDELPIEVSSLAQSVDAVLIGPDNMMMENPAVVASSAAEVGKPLFACDEASVEKGAVAGVSVNYRDVGTGAGRLAVEVLKGANPGELPVAVLESGGILVNKKAACDVGIELPPTLLAHAQVLNEDYECVQVLPDRRAFWVVGGIALLLVVFFVAMRLRRSAA